MSLPGRRLDLLPERLEALGVPVDEGRIVAAAFEHALGDAGQQRDVAADVRLHVQAGDLRAEQQAAHVARHAEVDQADSLTGLMTMTWPPRRRIVISVRISRGWFDAGLPPIRTKRSECSTSSSVTVAVPVPRLAVRPTPLAWWQ